MNAKSLNREILRLALPSILANLTVPLVGMVDIAVAGHLGGGAAGAAAFIGGVTIGSLLFDLLYWNFAFLRISTGGLVAQAFGRGDRQECADIFVRSVSLAMLLSVAVLLLQWPFQELAFLVVRTTPGVHDLALRYFLIRIWAAPATMSLMAFRGWFVGMQDSVSSMLTDLTVNVVNIIASIILTLGFGEWEGMGFSGIAAGTVVAQYSGLLLASLIVAVKYRHIPFRMQRPKREQLRVYMSMNSDLFIRSVCFIAIYVGFTTIAARYGDVFLSASSILMKILMLFSFFTDGFAYSGEALSGRFIGEGSRSDLRLTVRMVFIWSMGVAALFMVIYGFAGEWIVRVMTSDAEVSTACRPFLWWLLLMPPLGCAAFTWDGIYEGATASKAVRNAMIGALLAFFAVYFAGTELAGIPSESDGGAVCVRAMNLLMAAYFAHLLVRTVYLSLRYRRDILSAFNQ